MSVKYLTTCGLNLLVDLGGEIIYVQPSMSIDVRGGSCWKGLF